MLISTRKLTIKALMAAGLLFITGRSAAQSNSEVIEQIGYLLDDALFFSDKYVTPATDAAFYQSASGWMATPQKSELWDVRLSVHFNAFFIPGRDRSFTINNSDFTFFQLEEGTSATVPTAFGNDYQVNMIGQLGNDEVKIATPEGVNMEIITYPYFQGSVGLWGGTDLVFKYSPKVDFREKDFQVYGAGLKHNISQYFSSMETKNIYLAGMVSYSKEDISSSFLDIETDYGTLGITRIRGLVDTWQFQLNGSKVVGRFEFMGGVLINRSEVKYEVAGPKGTIEEIVPLQDVLNERLKEIYQTKVIGIGEASISYKINNFSIQTIVAFGKFVNTNASIQYSF